MGTVTVSLPADGTTGTVSQYNTPLTTIVNEFNGNIDNSNIKSGAAIDGSKLAANGVTSTQINFGGAGAGVWWEEIGRTTLSVAGATMSVTSLPARKYLRFIVTLTQTGLTAENITFNGDTGSNYAWRSSVNGAADTNFAAVANWSMLGDTSQYRLITGDISNILASPKLGNIQIDITSATGATVPNRVEFCGKWNNTAAQISRIDYTTSSSTFAIGSELIVLGHN